MGAHSLGEKEIAPIRSLASAEHLTILVGAGASVPSGLPTWAGLVTTLLETSFPGSETGVIAHRLISTQGLGLAAGAAIGDLSSEQKIETVARALYGNDRSAFAPSEMHRALADLVAHRRSAETTTKVLTTNYDDLLEAALSETGSGYRRRYSAKRPGGSGIMVEHLNGLLGQDGTDSSDLLITSGDYVREIAEPARDWRMDTFAEGARSGPVLFVGTSLTDPLAMQYLNALDPGDGDRLATFARIGFELPPRLEARFEEALRKQWEQFHVGLVCGDDYADSALLLREITVASRPNYQTPRERVGQAWRSLSRDFRSRQDSIAERLSTDAGDLEFHIGDEATVTLWLSDGEGSLVRFGGSHRVYTSEETLRRIPYAHTSSKWVITRALADGLDAVRISGLDPIDTERGAPSRRWRSVAAMAIAVPMDGFPPVTIGGLSIATTRDIDNIDHESLEVAMRSLVADWTSRLARWIEQ